jgi:hypothetical protein
MIFKAAARQACAHSRRGSPHGAAFVASQASHATMLRTYARIATGAARGLVTF